jgi:hypothetical protein
LRPRTVLSVLVAIATLLLAARALLGISPRSVV